MWKWLRYDLGETVEKVLIRVENIEEKAELHEKNEHARYETLLMEFDKMATRFQAALDRAGVTIEGALKTAIEKETEELKKAIADAANDTETNQAIDDFAARLAAKIAGDVDAISTNAGGSGTSTGGDTGGGQPGETPVP